jgi:hypothetical protein
VTARRSALLGLVILSAIGCRGVPFREEALVPLVGVDPETVRERFALALPTAFRIVNTVTFEFRGHSLAVIGYTQVDTSKRTFTVIGLHPAAGFKLFEVSGDSQSAEASYAVAALAEQGDLARAIGDDTRRMYFDRLPSPDAAVSREKYRILFRQPEGDGELEFVFAGSEGALVEKRYYENGGMVWSVSYYEYRSENGKLFPGGIVFDHHEYRYRLLVRLREILR